MDGCSSDCEKAGAWVDVADAPQVMAAAEKLASLLAETAEYQAFVRASRAVQFDAEVGSLVSRLNGYPGFDVDESIEPQDVLKERLESLLVVQEYRQAETAIRGLFSAVDSAISASAGVDFVANAAASACG